MMNKAEAIRIVERMGEHEAMGSLRTDPLPYELEAVSLLTDDEATAALQVGYGRIVGRKVVSC